jgi:hypothetical protein
MRYLAARDFDLPLTAQELNLRTKLATALGPVNGAKVHLKTIREPGG